ncbi:alpha/beta hydrolase [Bdellovibrio sp. HCB185ZH]|uniref:alpha/beta hydrolase n=1 Tax=Bdellovibrio sp. HCB185ZH TaxID=3394235 RepID=UPI0039A463F2
MTLSNTTLEFTERMAGHFMAKSFVLSTSNPLKKSDFEILEESASRVPFEFTLTIKVSDLDTFITDPHLQAGAVGTITDFEIEKGLFNLFVRPEASSDRDTAKEMHYTLFLKDKLGNPWTFFGFKEVIKEDSFEMWSQTTTLYYYIWEGHSDYNPGETKNVTGVGILRISVSDFIKQLTTFKSNAPSAIEEQEAVAKFLNVFAKNLWQSYAPFIFTTTTARWNEHLYPMNTTQGVAMGEKNLYPLDTPDGLTISVQRFKVTESKNVVLLLHGLTTSTDMFIMPEHQNFVNYLHSNGFTDVWSLDWRGSGRFTYNLGPHRYNLDDIAKNDIPTAVEYIRQQCGADTKIHVVCHCVGSISFMASLAAGHVKGISSIVSNSVSLTPKVRWQAFIKMLFGPELLEYVFGYAYVSPRMAYFPGPGFGKWLYWMERGIRHECKEPACHLVSFMWGWGYPAAYVHRNIHPTTHRRLVDLFGGTSFHYYRHIRKMLFAKASVSFDKSKNYLEECQKQDMPPTLFISGAENNIFPGSNKMTYEALKKGKNGAAVEYLEVPGYGHQDTFMGQYAHIEVFPKILAFLKKQKA